MDNNTISFDLLKCERSSRTIRGEYDKLIRMADKLASAAADIPNWWDGDSRYRFSRRANDLDSLIRKAAGLVLEMSENMNKSAEYKKNVEEHMKNEASKSVSFNIEGVTKSGLYFGVPIEGR